MSLTVLVVHPWKLLTDHRPNGDGLLAYGLVRRLAERGHRLHVACRAVDLLEPPPAGVTLHRLGAGDDLSVRARISFMRHLRSFHDRLAVRERIDIVHQTNPVEVGVSLALPVDAPPVVLGPYWADWPGASHPAAQVVRAGVRSLQQRRAAALLITTDAARAKLHVRNLPVTLIPPGVDLSAFPLASQPASRDRPPTAVFLANLRAHKGIFTLLDAFEEVARRLPDARLIVAGGGPDEAAVRSRVENSPSARRIELLGPVAPGQVPAVLARADVSCQPAHGEPFGWSAVEAMACGLPVVATDAGGLATVVPDAAGVKVPVGDARALATALEALLRNPARCAAMGRAGREAVATTYDWPGIIDRLEGVYADAIAARRRTR
jgi:glycosyltransferase involved in cell wall biosynthesis